MEKKAILITGAEGFVGSHAVRGALAKGYDVVALVHDKTDKIHRKQNRLQKMHGADGHLTIARGDITDAQSMEKLFNENPQIDTVIHAAALMIVPNNEDGKANAERVNTQGTRTLAKAANASAKAQGKITMFHYISSSHVLNHIADTGGQNFDNTKSLSSYAASKFAGEGALAGKSNLFSIVTYPPHMFGPDQEKNVLIPTLVRKALRGEPMQIIDDDKKMSYLHVDNFVADLLSTMDMTPQKAGSMRYAIEGDVQVSVPEIAGTVCDALDNIIDEGSTASFRRHLKPVAASTALAQTPKPHGLKLLCGERENRSLKDAVEMQVYNLLPDVHPML